MSEAPCLLGDFRRHSDVISSSQVVGKSWGADDSLAWLTDEVTNHPVWNTANAPLYLALWHNKTSPQLQKLESMGVEVRRSESFEIMCGFSSLLGC